MDPGSWSCGQGCKMGGLVKLFGVRTWSPSKEQFFFKKKWKMGDDCQQTKVCLWGPAKSQGWLTIINRSMVRLLNQLMTGPNNLICCFLMKMKESPTCKMCLLDKEMAEHFISDCPAYIKVLVAGFWTRATCWLSEQEDLQRLNTIWEGSKALNPRYSLI